MGLTWNDARLIGEALYDLDEETHPLTVRFTDLHAKILALPDFADVPEAASEGALEAIQMIWYEEWQDDHDASEDPYAQ